MAILYTLLCALILLVPVKSPATNSEEYQVIKFNRDSYELQKAIFEPLSVEVLGQGIPGTRYTLDTIEHAFKPFLIPAALQIRTEAGDKYKLNLLTFFNDAMNAMFNKVTEQPKHSPEAINKGWRCLLSKILWAKSALIIESDIDTGFLSDQDHLALLKTPIDFEETQALLLQQALSQQLGALFETLSMHKELLLKVAPEVGKILPGKQAGCIMCLIGESVAEEYQVVESVPNSTPGTPSLRRSTGTPVLTPSPSYDSLFQQGLRQSTESASHP